jgi:hypothetical protein
LSALIPHIKDLRASGDEELREQAQYVLVKTQTERYPENKDKELIESYLKGEQDVAICMYASESWKFIMAMFIPSTRKVNSQHCTKPTLKRSKAKSLQLCRRCISKIGF